MLFIETFKTNTKWQVITSVMVLITVTCCCFTLLIFHTNRENLHEYIDQVITSTSLVIRTIEEESSRPLKKRIHSIAEHRTPLLKAFARRDRAALQRQSAPVLSILKGEYPHFSSLAWISPDNIVFLRTHEPKLFGDDISTMRPDIVEVNSKHQQINGYNTGYKGIQFRIVEPLFLNGKHIGALQFGIAESQLLHSIQVKLGIPATIVVSNKTLATVTNPKQTWIQVQDYSLLSTQPDIFSKNQEHIDWSNPSSQIKYQDKIFIIRKVLDMTNFTGAAIGHIVVALDVTSKIKEARYHINLTILTSFLLICSSFIILNKSYTTLIQTIIDLNKNLQTANEQLTGEVAEHSKKLKLIGQAIEQASETIVITDKQGIIQYTNSAFEKLTGYTCAESMGKSSNLFKSRVQDATIYKQMWATILAGKIWVGSLVNQRKDGTTYDEHLTISPMFDQNGVILNFVAIKRDISEEVNLERQLQQMMKMESIGRLAGGIAHDFNNILSVINGYCDLCLMKMAENNPYRQYLTTIHESGLRAAKLTQQLLAFSRKQIIKKKIIYINEAIEEIHSMLGRLLGEDIDIKIKIPKTIWPIKADRSQLEQIIINLAVNSRDAMPLGGSLLISAQNITTTTQSQNKGYSIAAGDYIRLEFSDTGQGMSKEVCEKIFEPFFTTKEQGKGTGLGLATVYGIVKQNLGWINVYSEFNIGTTFTLYLPAERGYQQKSKESDSSANFNTLKGGSETILLVEDEDGVRDLCEEILTNLGYTVIGATDGYDALEVEKNYTGPIHLLLTDVVMPRMNGSELAPLIKKKRTDIEILFMSGYTEDSIAQHGILADNINFINKPISPTQLAEQVRTVLDGHHIQKQ